MLHGLEIELSVPAAPAPAESVSANADEYRARAQIYRLLGGVFLQEPTAEFLAALRTPEALGALRDAGLRFDADFTGTESAALIEVLACEYATLFVAAGGFPPVESVRLTGRYQQEPHFAARQVYRAAGFAVGPGRFAVFDDHLGVELTFVAELLDRAATALDAQRDNEFRAAEREIRRFWALHLAKWVRGYARLIERAAEHSLYREMAKLLREFAEAEVVLLRVRVDDEDHGRAVVPKSEVKVAFNPDEPECNACHGGR